MVTRQSSVSVREEAARAAPGKFQWPKEAELYQLPPDRELLPDRARRLMFQAYLKLAGLSFTDTYAPNADHMSPSGMSPFLVLMFGSAPVIYDDFFQFTEFIQAQHCGLGKELDRKEKAECEAFISLVKTAILPALEYETWINSSNWEFTRTQCGSGLPRPLHYMVPRLQWARYCWQHCDLYWMRKEEVRERFEGACRALAVRLDDDTFFPSGPTALDAVVYGGVEAVLTCQLASSMLRHTLDQFPTLQQYCHTSLLTQRKGLQFISSPSTANLLSLQS